MRYKVSLQRSEEGFSVSVPGLPGCWSQGSTENEALENIRDAIREYLAAVDELVKKDEVREVEVTVWAMPKLPGVNHLDAIRALEKAGFRVVRPGSKRAVWAMAVPGHNPVNAFTMGGIIRDAGLTIDEFKKLL